MDNTPNASQCCDQSPAETKDEPKNIFVDTLKNGFDKAFSGLKTATAIALCAIFACMCGCKSVPTVDEMENVSRAVGVATATVCNMTKINDRDRGIIVEIIQEVEFCVPETNQTFESAWTPIARVHVQKLVDEGKIDKMEGELILDAFKVVCKGMDYLVTVRYPKIRQYGDLVSAAVHGFCGGFLTYFKPANENVVMCAQSMDKDAYEYLYAYQTLRK